MLHQITSAVITSAAAVLLQLLLVLLLFLLLQCLHCCCCWPLPELVLAILVHMLPLLPASSAGACTLSISMMHFVSRCHLAAQIWPCTSHSQRHVLMTHVSKLAHGAAAHHKMALTTCVTKGLWVQGQQAT